MKYNQFRMIDLWKELVFTTEQVNDVTQLTAIYKRQVECLHEELNELLNAIAIKDKKETIDGYCDVIWVACMLASLLKINPIPEVKRLLKKAKKVKVNKYTFKYKRLNRSVIKLLDLKDGIFSSDPYVKSEIKDHIIATIYRGYLGLCITMDSDATKNQAEILADLCISEVIYSNFSKCVDGKLPKDNTGKITKQIAKQNGTYIEPNFNLAITGQSN